MSDSHISSKSFDHTEKLFFGIFLFVAVLFQVTVVQAADMTPSTILGLINAERTEAGLSPLKENAALSTAAEAKLKHMFQNDYFSHTSPKGETPWYWIKQSGYAYQYAGENLAINYTSAAKQHQAWMKSETHRANILSSKYTETGIAVRSGTLNGEAATITVEMFGAPRFAEMQQSPRSLSSEEEVNQKSVPSVLPVAVKTLQTSGGADMVMRATKNETVSDESVAALPREVPLWQMSWFQAVNISAWPSEVLYQATLSVTLLMFLVALLPSGIFLYEMLRYLFVLWKAPSTTKIG